MAWSRSAFTAGGGDAQLHVHLFSDNPLSVAEVRDGLGPQGWIEGAELTSKSREEDPTWVQTFLESPYLEQQCSKLLAARISGAHYCNSLRATLRDPSDLEHLRSVWRLLRWSAESGTIAAFDAESHCWVDIEDVLGWPEDLRFSLAREVSFILELDDTEPRRLAHTRGMRKFGRPEIVIPQFEPRHSGAAEYVLSAAAGLLADGGQLIPPQGFGVDTGMDTSPRLAVLTYPTAVQGFDGEDPDPPVESGLQICDTDAEGEAVAGLERFARWLSTADAKRRDEKKG